MTLHPFQEEVWTFARDNERLQLRRRSSDDGFLLTESQKDHIDRTYYFADMSAMEAFQTTLHQLLTKDGWRVFDYHRGAC